MAVTGGKAPRLWRWYGTAGLASTVLPWVFLQTTRLAHWQVKHPVIIPGDDSPGGGNMGSVAAVPLFGLATLFCLLFPLLWGIAAFRAGTGAVVKDLAVATATLQGVALLFALPAATFLPHSWISVTTLITAELLAVAAARAPRFRLVPLRKGSSTSPTEV